MNLTVTDEAVRKAAETCPDAKKTLEVLFPTAFKDVNMMRVSKEQRSQGGIWVNKPDGSAIGVVQHRIDGNYVGAIYLPPSYGFKWAVVLANTNQECLILTKVP